jgi:hypothetical protein
VGEETGVEGDQGEVELGGDIGGGLDMAPVFLPGGVGNDATGSLDGIEGGIILAHGSEHAGDHLATGLEESGGGVAPEVRFGAEGVEVELDAADAGGGEAFDEGGWGIGLKRPAADSQA